MSAEKLELNDYLEARMRKKSVSHYPYNNYKGEFYIE